MRYTYEGLEFCDKLILSRAVTGTRRHALIYHQQIAKLQDILKSASGAAILISTPAVPVPAQTEKEILFNFNCSVSFLGAKLRLDTDRGLQVIPNIAEHCRYLSAHATINGNKRFSAQSLRNAYDNPRPEVIEQVEAEIKASLRYLGKLKDRQIDRLRV